MNTVPHTFDADELPTKRVENTTTRMLAFAARVDRLAELAIERLGLDPDEHTILAALEDLAAIRQLAQAVTR